MPFPTVVGLFAHWKDEPPIAMSIAALAGFKKKSKMTAAEEAEIAANSKVIAMQKLPPAFQTFVHKAKKEGEKKQTKVKKRG